MSIVQSIAGLAATALLCVFPITLLAEELSAGSPAETPAVTEATTGSGTDSAAVVEDGVSAELGKIRGLVKPTNEAKISTDILAQVIELPFQDGESFNKDDVLVRFDCSRFSAELNAARAAYSAHKKTHDNSVELARYDAASKLQVEVSGAEANKAAADVEVARVNASHCTIRAPWSGRVVDTMVNKYETVTPGMELVHILDDSRLEIELIVPSKWLTWLKPGTEFLFRVDETGVEQPVQVARIGASVDPVSQTVRIAGVFANADKGLLAGMSGTAHFSVPQ